MIFLQTDIVDAALKVSPYNNLVFGFLIAVLIAGNIWMGRSYLGEKNAYRELANESLKLMQSVSDKLTETKDIKKNLENLIIILESEKNLRDEIRTQLSSIKDLLRGLNA